MEGTKARRHEATKGDQGGSPNKAAGSKISVDLLVREIPEGAYGSASLCLRLNQIGSLTVRQGQALSMLFHGFAGLPLKGGSLVDSRERAVKMVLDLVADAAGLE